MTITELFYFKTSQIEQNKIFTHEIYINIKDIVLFTRIYLSEVLNKILRKVTCFNKFNLTE